MARSTPVHAGFAIANGAGTGSNGSRMDVWVEYQYGVPDAAANTTPFEAYFYAALRPGQTSSTQLTYGLDSVFSVDGISGSAVANGAYNFTSPDNIHLLGSWAGTLSHNSDGTKAVEITGSFTTRSEYISGGNVTVTVVLPVIPRASSVGATDAAIGSVSMVAVNRRSGSYTHSIQFRFGSLSGYLTADGGISEQEVRLPETSIPFKLPESFYTQIPNAKTGVCDLTCRTYAGDARIGDAQSATFIATAAESLCSPLVTGRVTDTNPATVALTADAGKLVRYRSTALCTLEAAARNGASVVSKTVDGNPLTGDSVTITAVERGSVRFWAQDSRGYAGTAVVEAELIPYIPLTASATAHRPNPTDGSGVIRVSGNYFNGSFGAAQNSLSVRCRVGGGAWMAVTPVVSGSGYTAEAALTGLDYQSQYGVEVEVSDRLTTLTQQLTLKRGLPVFDWGEGDFRFHVPVVFEAGFVTKNLTRQ